MEKVIYFLDYANIDRAAKENNVDLDYSDLLQYIGEDRFLVDAYCYVPIDPRLEHSRDREIEDLWISGYQVTKKIGTIAGDSYKCDFDVEMTIDILRIVHVIKPDIVVLASGDVDFLPVVSELRKMGVRVEIAGFQNSTSRLMILQGSSFIDLDVYYHEDYLVRTNDDTDLYNE